MWLSPSGTGLSVGEYAASQIHLIASARNVPIAAQWAAINNVIRVHMGMFLVRKYSAELD